MKLTQKVRLEFKTIDYAKGYVEYDPIVASQILEQLSYDIENVHTWNKAGAPNADQMKKHIKASMPQLLQTFSKSQITRVLAWMQQGDLNSRS